jgi:ATP-binding cassette subfamily B protein
MRELQHVNKYFYKYRYKLLAGVLITIVARIFLLFTPELVGNSVDVIDNYRKGVTTDLDVVKSKLLINVLYIVGAAVIGGVFTFLMRQTIIYVSRQIEYDLKNEVYQQYQRLSLDFYKSNRTGDLMSRISEDVGKVREYAGPALMYSINTVTLFVIALILMFNSAPTLTLYTIIPLSIF